MQTTTKTFEESYTQLEPASNFEQLTIFKCDPDEFKKFFEEELEEASMSEEEPVCKITISPMDIAIAKNQELNTENKTLDIAPINLEKTLDLLLENMSLLVSHITLAGIDHTSITIQDNETLLDNTEIIIERYDTAPGEFNIEIKACSKLQALLINQKESLLERMAYTMPTIKINRMDISSHASKDYIGDSKQKKVVRGEKTKK